VVVVEVAPSMAVAVVCGMPPIEPAVLVNDKPAAAVDLRRTGIVVLDAFAHHCVHVVPALVKSPGIALEVVVLVDDCSMLARVAILVVPLVGLVGSFLLRVLVVPLVRLVGSFPVRVLGTLLLFDF